MKKVFFSLACCTGLALSTCMAADTLESVKTDAKGLMDFNNPEWNKAKVLTFEINEQPYKSTTYKGIEKTKVQMQSLYNNNNLYVKVVYDDPTESLERFPWEKQADGTWKMKKDPDNFGRENTYYEDRFSIFWNINARGFDRRGCAVTCHMAENGKQGEFEDKRPGRKYTRNLKETVDMWHTKSVRTTPAGQVDDQYISGNNNPTVSANYGRMSDERTGGGYKDNINESKNAPAYMDKTYRAGQYWIMDVDKVPFVDTFKVGDKVPSMIVKEFSGSRGDVEVNAKWENGQWSYIFKRALVTSHPKSAEQDVQFADLDKAYSFGVAVFDNAQVNHIYHEGAKKLVFKK